MGVVYSVCNPSLGAIQVLRNARGVGGCQISRPENSVTKVYASMLLALRGGGWVSIFQKKRVM